MEMKEVLGTRVNGRASLDARGVTEKRGQKENDRQKEGGHFETQEETFTRFGKRKIKETCTESQKQSSFRREKGEESLNWQIVSDTQEKYRRGSSRVMTAFRVSNKRKKGEEIKEKSSQRKNRREEQGQI